MTAAPTGTGPSLATPTVDCQQASVTQEIAKLADDLEEEVKLLRAVGATVEDRMEALFGGSIIPPETDRKEPEADATHSFARLSRSIRQIQYYRSRLETCCNRL